MRTFPNHGEVTVPAPPAASSQDGGDNGRRTLAGRRLNVDSTTERGAAPVARRLGRDHLIGQLDELGVQVADCRTIGCR
jgi:hypothetical protein